MVAADSADDKTKPLIEGEATGCQLPEKCGGVARCCNPIIHKLNSFETKWARCLAWTAFLGFWWFLFRGIIQFFMFHFATMGCSASGLTDYRYPGGGWTCPREITPPTVYSEWHTVLSNDPHDQHKCKYSPEDNVVPALELILEQPSSLFGKSFAVFPATAGTATIDQAQVGVWWRTWGPWFWTYTYQDMHSKTTLYMRPTIMGMMGLYSESRIMRCDGAGDVWFFGEGSNWVGNRIRTFFGSIFGMQREGTFKIYKDSEQYGTALETFHGQKSITFQRGSGNNQATLGSAVLTSNSDHPHSDMWAVHKEHGTNFREFPPYYVTSAASLLMAFRWITVRHSKGIPAGHSTAAAEAPPSFLAQTSNASVTFFEETEEDVHPDPEPLKDDDEGANTETSEAAGEKV